MSHSDFQPGIIPITKASPVSPLVYSHGSQTCSSTPSTQSPPASKAPNKSSTSVPPAIFGKQ